MRNVHSMAQNRVNAVCTLEKRRHKTKIYIEKRRKKKKWKLESSYS